MERRWRWVRRPTLLALAAIMTAAGPVLPASAAPPAPGATPQVWNQWLHVPAIFDIAGPRSDGRFVVANGGLLLLDRTGATSTFAPGYSSPPGAEAYLAMSPGLTVDGTGCSFATDELAALDLTTNPPGVNRISPTGIVSHLATIAGATSLGGITFDVTGQFAHRLLVTGGTAQPGTTVVAAVDCNGAVTTVGVVGVPLEGGIVVAPAGFGSFGGQLIAPNELDGSIYAVSPSGQLSTVAQSGLPAGGDIGVESLGFVPAAGHGAALMADRGTPGNPHPGTDSLLRLDAAKLTAAGVVPGDLLAGTEGGGTVARVHCAATCTTGVVVDHPTTAHSEGKLLVPPPVGASGYWLAGADGGVFAFGRAGFFGSAGGLRLNRPVVGMAATPSGNGYWLVASDGGVFSYGDAKFFGSAAALPLNQPIVGMAATPTGHGYWLVASDGGVFSYGDARFFGSTGSLHLNRPVAGIATTPTGNGYWLVASDGGVFSFGDAAFAGSLPAVVNTESVVAIAPNRNAGGYVMASTPGVVYGFGDGPDLGGLPQAVPGYAGSIQAIAVL